MFWESDSVFFGLSDEGADRKDAIINWGDNSDDQLRFLFTGFELMRLTPQGSLGLGTITPDARFHVYQETSARIKVESGADGLPGIELAEDGAVKWALINDSTNDTFVFRNGPVAESIDHMTISSGGNVGIGTSGSIHKLAVNGSIRAKEVIVDTGWADYVFEPGYALVPLAEVERHITEKGHLPDVPPAAEVSANGISVGEAQAILLRKVEELTLHLIAQEKELVRLRSQMDALAKESADGVVNNRNTR